MVGCGAMCTFSFAAIAPGQGTLKLIYHRIWEKGVPPLQTFEVAVSVDAVPVPTMTEWGMMLFVIMAGTAAVSILYKQKKVV